MIEFVTLLLGLVAGSQTVELNVDQQVARVEVMLDGATVATLRRPPWLVSCDFGDRPTPRELLAIAFDSEGQEVARVNQWVNVPRERIEARLALDRDAEGTATARLIWSALDYDRPTEVRLSFDGQPLEALDFERIALPPHDPKSLHFLRAELVFSDSESTHAELVFGGTFRDTVRTELTAVALVGGKRLPKIEAMDGWFERHGEPLRVVAVERGPVNLLVIREKAVTTLGGLKRIHEQQAWQKSRSRRPLVHIAVLNDNDRVRFAFPMPRRQKSRVARGVGYWGTEQVPVSLNVANHGPLFGILTNAFFPDQDVPIPEQQLRDAVAVAGVVAAAGDQRRMVVLIRSGESKDTSRFEAEEVRAYLRDLRVPLRVWTVTPEEGRPPSPVWREEVDVSNIQSLRQALNTLRRTLDSQLIVWLDGAHPSHEVELTGKAVGLRPVE